MKNIIEELFKLDRRLMGPGIDSALEFINHLIPLEIKEVPTGTELGTWKVPEEWVLRDAWVKFKGRKILDVKKVPLAVADGSIAFKGKMDLEELKKHLHTSDERQELTPYVYNFYEDDWGFCIPKYKYDKLKEGEYEVFVDSERKPGNLKYGVHTIKGKSDREILLFAHLDHPHQANDNLSGVACLVDLAKKVKCQHTVKIVFCPETIGSHAYAIKEDLSKVEFVIALDVVGNDNSLLMQKSFRGDARIDRVAGLALNELAKPFRKSVFRGDIGSDEYAFNDPNIGIPGILFTTHPYDEYHTEADTPEKIHYPSIRHARDVILKTIEIYEKDFIPHKLFKGQLMRSRYGVQALSKQMNFASDYFFYNMDGQKWLSQLCGDCGINFKYYYELMEKLEKDGKISRLSYSKEDLKEATK